jgi:hypothetical protein
MIKMLAILMTNFKIFPRPVTLEASIPLNTDTPEDIKGVYEEKYFGKLAAWVSPNTIGCIQNNRCAYTNKDYAVYLTLFEIKPAKGSGWLGLTVNSKENQVMVTLFQSRHSEKSLRWLEKTQEDMASFYKLEAQYNDRGFDV